MGCNQSADKVNCPEADGPDFDFGSSAMLVELGATSRILVAGQKSGMVHAVDPDRNGEIVWQQRAGQGESWAGSSSVRPRTPVSRTWLSRTTGEPDLSRSADSPRCDCPMEK